MRAKNPQQPFVVLLGDEKWLKVVVALTGASGGHLKVNALSKSINVVN